MADQGKWFKLWESALDDQDLENLSVHEWFCWARFGTYLKKHGKDGKIRLRAPATALTNLLRLPSFANVISVVKSFPNYVVEEGKSETIASVSSVTNESVTYNVSCINWSKYQSDYSTDRVRAWRKQKHVKKQPNETLQEEKRREVEEKRIPQTPVAAPVSTSPAAEPATARANGLQPAGQIVSTLKINGKPYVPEPEIPESKRMSAEEMRAIRLANMNQAKATPGATPGGDDDVF